MSFNNQIEYVEYDGHYYPYRLVDISNFGVFRVATISLDNVLMDEKGNYRTEQATGVDELFFFYVQDNEIHFDGDHLAQIVLKAVA